MSYMATDQHGSFMATDQPVIFCDGSIYTYIYGDGRQLVRHAKYVLPYFSVFGFVVIQHLLRSGKANGFVFSETISCHVIENVFGVFLMCLTMVFTGVLWFETTSCFF